jgi:putative NADH-flavin reductase
MKLTVFAATGGIGRQVLEQAVAAGHDVTAVVRNPQNLPSTQARVVPADLATADPHVLQPAVEGADAVLSALGARSKAEAGVAWRGTQAVTRAMQAAGVRRIVVVSAAPCAQRHEIVTPGYRTKRNQKIILSDTTSAETPRVDIDRVWQQRAAAGRASLLVRPADRG